MVAASAAARCGWQWQLGSGMAAGAAWWQRSVAAATVAAAWRQQGRRQYGSGIGSATAWWQLGGGLVAAFTAAGCRWRWQLGGGGAPGWLYLGLLLQN